VAAVYFSGIDAVSHLYWHWTFPEEFPSYQIPQDHIQRLKDVIPEYYVLMDEYIGQLVAAAGPNTTVMILSDHGFGGTGRLPWSGGHDSITKGAPIAPPGVLILSGPGIGHSNTPGKAHVLDIAPTLLYLMGLPASKEMSGRVLTEAMAPGSPAELPRVESYERIGTPRQIGEMVSEPLADAERIERLRALGYVK
jgi:predicted AlkP superfamily phosphohydrolase/phosphomutase